MKAPEPNLAATYWEQRARQFAWRGRGLAAVCSYGMPSFYNRYIEFCQRRALLPCLERSHADRSAALDIGCGVGRWSLELAARGYQVTGLDLSAYMLERARLRTGEFAAQCSFVLGDVATLQLERRYDLILSVTVLQHVLDAERARAAIARLAAHLNPGGKLVLLEAAPSRPATRCDSAVFRARTVGWYREALQEAGLSVIALRGVDPMPLKTWLLPHYRRLPAAMGKMALALTTALSLPGDWVLGPWLPQPSWHKVLVAQRVVAQRSRERERES